jgi:hypothetical protein
MLHIIAARQKFICGTMGLNRRRTGFERQKRATEKLELAG